MIYERTRAAVQRRIDSGLTDFKIGEYRFWVGRPVIMLHNVECQLIHRADRNYYESYLYLWNGRVFINESDMYAAAKEATP